VKYAISSPQKISKKEEAMKYVKKCRELLTENWLSFLLFSLSILNFNSPYPLQSSPSRDHSAWVDFDISMSNHYKPGAVASNLYSSEVSLVARVLKNLYNHNKRLMSVASPTPKIPKIIHQIWLGSPFPDKYKKYQESWIRHHPDWEYKLWTDKEVKKLKLYNQEAYENAPNYGEKSDILRYELLFRFGGLYVDIDFECLQPFDIFHHTYQVYVGIMRTDNMRVNNALIGSVPEHGFLKDCIKKIIPAHDHYSHKQTIQRTGPAHFTRCFLKYITHDTNEMIAFPISFFYPIPIKVGKFHTLDQIRFWIRPETFAVHYWAGSWTHGAGVVRPR
jgi:mannosyltransferase OCH1-like enzyme